VLTNDKDSLDRLESEKWPPGRTKKNAEERPEDTLDLLFKVVTQGMLPGVILDKGTYLLLPFRRDVLKIGILDVCEFLGRLLLWWRLIREHTAAGARI